MNFLKEMLKSSNLFMFLGIFPLLPFSKGKIVYSNRGFGCLGGFEVLFIFPFLVTKIQGPIL